MLFGREVDLAPLPLFFLILINAIAYAMLKMEKILIGSRSINAKGRENIMPDYAILRNSGEYTIFQFNNQIIRFVTSSRLERYTRVIEWDHGYLVVMAKYRNLTEVEEKVIPILQLRKKE